jgi:hypothetical protein
LDVYYNFGRVDQVIGRAIRQCKHYKITNENNPFPEVKIYKYVVTQDDGLSTEENLYRKAELKYLLIKKVERSMKEISIDCPINYNGNVFLEETNANKGCYQPKIGEKFLKHKHVCSDRCDFMECDYKCHGKKLNLEYYDTNSKLYIADFYGDQKNIVDSMNTLNYMSDLKYIKKIEIQKPKLPEIIQKNPIPNNIISPNYKLLVRNKHFIDGYIKKHNIIFNKMHTQRSTKNIKLDFLEVINDHSDLLQKLKNGII